MSGSSDSPATANPVLEPSSSGLQSTLQIVKNKKTKGPPTITAPVANSGLLSRVRGFLPEMARAETELKARVEAGDSVDIEDVADGGRHIEMNVGVMAEAAEGTSDSDSDSSESHEDANNEFTSDSDIDSSSSTGGFHFLFKLSQNCEKVK